MENRKTTKRYLWVKELTMYVRITEEQWDKLISDKKIDIEKICIYKEIFAKPKIQKQKTNKINKTNEIRKDQHR